MKSLFAAGLVILLSICALAQDRVSVSVLYSNVQVAGQIRPGGTVGFDVKIYDTERLRLGLIGEVSYNFDTKRATDLQTAFGGFRLAYRAPGNLTPFVHAKYGASKSKYKNSTLRFTPYPATAFGGGVDYRLSDRFSIRVLQVDAVNVDRLQPRLFVLYGSGIVVNLF